VVSGAFYDTWSSKPHYFFFNQSACHQNYYKPIESISEKQND
jgi:hypothetical protein